MKLNSSEGLSELDSDSFASSEESNTMTLEYSDDGKADNNLWYRKHLKMEPCHIYHP